MAAGLILLLLVELLALSVRFDTQSLTDMSRAWGQAAGFAPDVVRVFTTAAVVALLVGLIRGASAHAPQLPSVAWRSVPLAVHASAVAAFFFVSRQTLERDPVLGDPSVTLVTTWASSATAVVATWALALWTPGQWRRVLAEHRASLFCGLVAGVLSWGSGLATQELWRPLARYTFALVTWTLNLFYTNTVADPARLVVGTPRFKVAISPSCSGVEGIALIIVFLGGYLWLYRRDLKFPRAYLLLPLGIASMWLANAMRIVALVAIGTAGWREVAAGGFHSQAGWILFNAIALTFVGVSMRVRAFARDAEPTPHAEGRRSDETTPYLAPFVALTAGAMLTGALTGGFEWLYPLRVLAVAVVLWMFRERYTGMLSNWSWWPLLVGGATFATWLVFVPATDNAATWPEALRSVPWYWAAAWLFVRTAGFVVAAPLAEELAFRGFLRRWIVRRDFEHVPMGIFTWGSFLASSVLFGLLHGSVWFPATVAGMLFAIAVQRRGTLRDAVQAHATTNGLIALYVMATGQWYLWG